MANNMEEFNKLAVAQEELAQKIKQTLSNSKKDPASRKNEAYIASRNKVLDDLWNAATKNHADMGQLSIPTHNYFTTGYYDQIKAIYDEAKNYLQTCSKSPEVSNPSDSRRQEEVVANPEQTVRIRKLQIRIQNFKQAMDDAELEQALGRPAITTRELREKWDRVVEMDEEVMSNDIASERIHFSPEYTTLEDRFRNLIILLQAPTRNERAAAISLPQVKIPIYEGNYEEWATFKDLFTKLVDDKQNMDDVIKMQYLKTHVKGEPSRLIQHLAVTQANYNTAWNLLQQRYQNDRLILNKLLDTIFDLPVLSKESAQGLKRLHDSIKECVEAIKNLGISTDSWGPWINRAIARKWDPETHKLYEQSLQCPNEVQDHQNLMAFLQVRFQSLEFIDGARKPTQEGPPKNYASASLNCKMCHGNHYIDNCSQFQRLPNHKKQEAIKAYRLCYRCLRHDSNIPCRAYSNCRICRFPHHTLLHKAQPPSRTLPAQKMRTSAHAAAMKTSNAPEKNPKSDIITANVGKQESQVLLATAMVQVKAASGMTHLLRVLIDPGSQGSFITEASAELLALPRTKVRAEITGIGNNEPKIAKWKIPGLITPRFSSNFSLPVNLLVLPKLTKAMPSSPIPNINMNSWSNIFIADPTFNRPGPIDLILGAEEYSKIILEGITKKDGILGQNTELGWVLSGTIGRQHNNRIKVNTMVAKIEEDEQLQKFWNIEEVPTQRKNSPDDQVCENKFTETVQRDEDGRYIVKIPFKQTPVTMGRSKPSALARLLQLEKKLGQDQDLEIQYKKFMQEYLDLGHMEIVEKNQENSGKYYIPHHCVIREASSSSKLRVVFDASSKTSYGKSLNEVMYAGPKLQQELVDILLRWRTHKVVFSADIEKMYRQIRMDSQDQEYQRILWRFDQSQPIREYRLCTVTYGTASAPYLAIRTLHQLAEDEQSSFPLAAEIVKRDFYVDDVLSGADTLEDAIKQQGQLISLLKRGGFSLHKWSSNEVAIIHELPDELKKQTYLELGEDGIKKSLGVHWSPYEDVFCFKVDVKQKEFTKRTILSEVAKIFDPLGWLAPVIISAKLLIQELWLENIKWDDPVSENIQSKWETFKSQLKSVEEITIPRWLFCKKEDQMELHGFCDASEKAIGAVVYTKIITSSGQTKVSLLIAKSKVAPARAKTTLPRLELCAAVLLSNLLQRVITTLDIPNVSTFAWTDSMVTLGWIKGDPVRWKTFVANRVAEINNLIPAQHWNHVRSEENPADVISRGISPGKLKEHVLWWDGPSWLVNKELWPCQPDTATTNEEAKGYTVHQVTVHQDQNEVIHRFSSLTRMVRVVSYCRRFINKCRRLPIHPGCLSVKEMEDTILTLIKVVQGSDPILRATGSQLQRRKCVDSNNKLANLNPFIDQHGIIRVGGRLQNSTLSFHEKHPIILPYSNHVSKLIIHEAHLRTLHGGTQLTLSYIRRKYWIINAKKAVSSSIKKCFRCIRFKAEAAQQLMGNLPSTRVNSTPPFFHSGVDYAGPIQIRTSKGRGHSSSKGYIAVFVCLSTKAIHLEAVSDMTTNSFLAVFRRFIARRGRCAHLYSDNGTNFVGARKVLDKEIRQAMEGPLIQEKLSTIGTQWHFIPPVAPHFGGIWEAGVKSMKHHLKRTIGNATLTFEELTTLLCQIEACLNSRPLCPQSNDIEDTTALTPGHFLIGREIISPPDPISTPISTNLSNRWRIIQKIKQDFWKSWSSDYLHGLQQRNKWKKPVENTKVGDLVLIKEENINPSKWPLARVTDIHPAPDGSVRVVTIQKSGGHHLKRSIGSIIPLSTTNEELQEPESEEKISANSTHTRSFLVPRKAVMSKWKVFLLVLTLLATNTFSKAEFTIQKPEGGYYVEHIGHGKIERGTFRIEIQFERGKIEEDFETVTDMVDKFDNLCDSAKELSEDTLCKTLGHHLLEQKRHMEWIKTSMEDILIRREKRGVLGTVLTSIFGVNDEVYQDIDRLDKNQQELIKMDNQQSKFLLSALSRFNETEKRIDQKLEHFQEKLNQGIRAINNMDKWYKATDSNRLNIHIISVYQVATNVISELCNYHTNILNVHFQQGNFYELITPAHIKQILANATSKLSPNLEILPAPILKVDIGHDDIYINVQGYFSIVEKTEYTLIKVTPIPLQINNGSYWVIDVPKGIFAVDYNLQMYFQETDEEFKENLQITPNTYICSPTVVKGIENNPNCIIDDIYHRTEISQCRLRRHQIQSIIWKQLYMENTWMFVVNKPTRIAITCSGNREEVTVNTTGVVQISSDCIIQTTRNTLTPRHNKKFKILAGYSKAISINFTHTITHHSFSEIAEEPVLKQSDHFEDLQTSQLEFQQHLQDITWKTIRHHSYLSSGITGSLLGAAVLIGAFYVIRKRIHRRKHPPKPRQLTVEEYPLKTLNVAETI